MAHFFGIFHALSFELNFFFDQRCPLITLVLTENDIEKW